jgi:hypothetical protein
MQSNSIAASLFAIFQSLKEPGNVLLIWLRNNFAFPLLYRLTFYRLPDDANIHSLES